MKPVVLITTCKKNLKRIQAIENTWAKILQNQKISYFYVTSDFIPAVPLLKLRNFKECYEQLPLKTFLALKAIQDIKYTHVIKLDDDTFFDYTKLNANFYKFDYIGKFNKIINSETVHFYKVKSNFRIAKRPAKSKYAEGGFYMISKKAVKKILTQTEESFINCPGSYKGEDVLMGELLASKKFKKLDLNTQYSESLNMDITKDGLSLHPVHYSLYNDIYCKSEFLDKLHILQVNYAKNDYNRRDIFLKLYEKNSSTGSSRG